MSEKKDRVVELRNQLELSQTDFGKQIKLSQRAISHIESGTNNLSPRNIELICQKFNVNRRWLEYGEGEMFNPPPEEIFLDKLAKEKGLNDEEKALIGSIIDLPREARLAVIDWAYKLVARIEVQVEDNNEERIRELERTMSECQKKLDELKQGVSPYVEDTSIGVGEDFNN